MCSVDVQHLNGCTYHFDGVLHPKTVEADIEEKEIVVGTGLFGWPPALGSVLRTHPDVSDASIEGPNASIGEDKR